MTDSDRDLTPTTDAISPFDAIKHHDERADYWSARELAALLRYKPNAWHNFEGVIEQAMEACRGSAQEVDAHFERVETQSPTARRRYTVKDGHLSRYGAYLVVQNADPSKEVVALGQTYFAVRTRQDEVMSSNRWEIFTGRLFLTSSFSLEPQTSRRVIGHVPHPLHSVS